MGETQGATAAEVASVVAGIKMTSGHASASSLSVPLVHTITADFSNSWIQGQQLILVSVS